LKAWNGIGLCNVHSNVVAVSVSFLNCSVDVKKEGIFHGLVLTRVPLANISNKI
jgi:hypothetical protein